MKLKKLATLLFVTSFIILTCFFVGNKDLTLSKKEVNAGGRPNNGGRIYLHGNNNRYGRGGVIPMSSTAEPSITVNTYDLSGDVHVNVYEASIDDVLKYLVHDEKNNQLEKKVDTSELNFLTSFTHNLSEERMLLPIDNKIGVWLLNIKKEDSKIDEDVYIIRSNNGIVAKEGNKEIIFWAQNFNTKRKVPYGNLKVYDLKDKINVLSSSNFDKDGITTSKLTPNADIAVAKFGDEYSFVLLNLTHLNSGYRYEQFKEPSQDIKYFLFTDRPLYQPGDTVYFKSILRQDRDAIYSIPNGTVTVEMYKGWGDNKTVVFTEKYNISNTGTIDGEYKLPEDLRTGNYKLNVKLDGAEETFSWWGWGVVSNTISFDVEYYQKPEYGLEIETDKKQYLAGDNLIFDIKANYFSGHPVSDKEVDYKIYSTEYYNYGYYRDVNDTLSDNYRYGYYQQRGKSYTGKANIEDGKARVIHEKLYAHENKDMIYTIEATFNDETGKPVTARKNVLVRSGEYGIYRKAYSYAKANKEFDLDLILAPFGDYNVYNKRLDVRIERTSWNCDNGYRSCNKETETLPNIKVYSDKNGEAVVSFTPLKRGSYRIYITAQDDRGNTIKNDFYVWASDSNSSNYYYGEPSDKELDIISEKDEYDPKDVVDVTIISKIPDRDVLLTMERDWAKRYQVISLDGNSKKIKMPLKGEDVPNIFIRTSSFSDTFLDTGLKNLSVSAEGKKVNIEIKPNKEKYGPGDFVSIDIKTTDGNGYPVSAEVATWAVDKALYELRPSNVGDIFNTFWKKRWLSTSMSHSLRSLTVNAAEKGCFSSDTQILMKDKSTKNIADVKVGDIILTRESVDNDNLVEREVEKTHEHDVEGYLIINSHLKITPNHKLFVNDEWNQAGNIQIGDYLINTEGEKVEVVSIEWQKGKYKVYNLTIKDKHTFFAGDIWVHNDKGGGGAPRTVLKDAAYWNPKVRTNRNGEARISFKLPDNLTTWVVSTVASTQDSKVGKNLKDIIVTKDVIVSPILPNILRIDDEIKISALVKNFTDEDKTFNVYLSLEGADNDTEKKTVRINSKESAQLYWDVIPREANEEAEIEIRAVAEDDDELGDVLITKIPVREYGFFETKGYSGTGNKDYFIKLATSTDVAKTTIELSTFLSLTGSLPNAMKYLVVYPHGCMEQTTSRFVPVVIAKENRGLFNDATKGKDIDGMVLGGIRRLRQYQQNDGGWAWYSGSSDPFITSYVVEYLVRAKEAGIEVNEEMLKDANKYLNKVDANDRNNYVYKEYSLSFLNPESSRNKITDFKNISIDALPFAVITNIRSGFDDPKKNGLNLLIAKGIKDGDKMYWDAGPSSRFGSTDASTSFALKAIVLGNGNKNIIDMAVRYLTESREGNRWSNTYSTARVIDALTTYHNYSEKLKGSNNYVISIDGKEVHRGKISSSNKLETIEIPTNKIKKEGSNISIRQEGKNRIYSDLIVNEFNKDKNFKGTSGQLSIKRNYKNVKGENYSIGVGDVVEVSIELEGFQHNNRYILIEDHLPAGMVTINSKFKSEQYEGSRPNYYGYYYYGGENKEITQDGMKFYLPYYSNSQRVYTYKARVINEGTFIAPPAKVSFMYEPKINAMSSSSSVFIENKSKKLYEIEKIVEKDPIYKNNQKKSEPVIIKKEEKKEEVKMIWVIIASATIFIGFTLGTILFILKRKKKKDDKKSDKK